MWVEIFSNLFMRYNVQVIDDASRWRGTYSGLTDIQATTLCSKHHAEQKLKILQTMLEQWMNSWLICNLLQECHLLSCYLGCIHSTCGDLMAGFVVRWWRSLHLLMMDHLQDMVVRYFQRGDSFRSARVQGLC
jgi:hypothetical protein